MSRLFFLLCCSLIAPIALTAAASAKLEWKKTPTSTALWEGSRVLWQFNYGPDAAKPYFHPITATDGEELTVFNPKVYPSHRGLWWSWKYIDGLNYWDEDANGQTQGKTTVKSVEIETRLDFSAKIHLTLAYHPANLAPVLTEDRVIEVTAPGAGGSFTITWNAKFVAEKQPVLFESTSRQRESNESPAKTHAGLSLQLGAPTNAWDFSNSEGDQSEATVNEGTARYAKFGLPDGPYVQFWDDEKSNPRFPTTWSASKTDHFLGADFLYRGAYTLPPGKSLNFGYRVAINPSASRSTADATMIKIAVVPGKMKYDVESFDVLPGSIVTLRLRNDDDMLHNIVLCHAPPTFAAQLGDAVLKMGESGLKNNYVPDLPEIIAHTSLVEPGQGQTINFTAPTAEGDYSYFCTMPGHWVLMNGIMHVTKSPRIPVVTAPVRVELPADEILVQQSPRVDRLPMPDWSPSALAIGLPGGFNYCFDVENLAVRYGWSGKFIDNAPNLYRRGGDNVKLLGPRFEVGYAGSPWLGHHTKPALAFKGYRIGAKPTLLFTIDGVAFSQTVSAGPGGRGIMYEFEVIAATQPIHFKLDPSHVSFSATAGSWQNGELTVTPAAAGGPTRFSISIAPQP